MLKTCDCMTFILLVLLTIFHFGGTFGFVEAVNNTGNHLSVFKQTGNKFSHTLKIHRPVIHLDRSECVLCECESMLNFE